MEVIEGKLEQDLLSLVRAKAPSESVGLILSNRRVIELPNRSDMPEDTFETYRSDIAKALEGVEDVTGITLWHSHPGGGVGPSRTDMQQKTSVFDHLVITLVADEPVYTWY